MYFSRILRFCGQIDGPYAVLLLHMQFLRIHNIRSMQKSRIHCICKYILLCIVHYYEISVLFAIKAVIPESRHISCEWTWFRCLDIIGITYKPFRINFLNLSVGIQFWNWSEESGCTCTIFSVILCEFQFSYVLSHSRPVSLWFMTILSLFVKNHSTIFNRRSIGTTWRIDALACFEFWNIL